MATGEDVQLRNRHQFGLGDVEDLARSYKWTPFQGASRMYATGRPGVLVSQRIVRFFGRLEPVVEKQDMFDIPLIDCHGPR